MELPDEGPDAGEGGMQHGIGRVPPFPRLGGVLARRVGRQRPQQQIGDAEDGQAQQRPHRRVVLLQQGGVGHLGCLRQRRCVATEGPNGDDLCV